MPYYNDVPYYYGGTYANHSSLMTGIGRPFTPLSRYSPHLSTISESPLNHLHRFSPISVRHVRRVIDTADIDVSTPRILSHDGNRPGNRLRRDRPTIKIRSQALKDNPAIREHNERHEKSVGELLMEKFFIKDKKPGDDGQQIRLYHQVSLERDENPEEQETVQKRITRRFTRRRSSSDLDPEQLQREATYAQVQAKVLDSLVAEEQAQIENEARCGTLIRKGTVRGPTTVHPYYPNNTDSDVMTQEEEEAAALRIRKAMKKAKKKKKATDKPSPPDKIAAHLDSRRSSTSSEMSTDSKAEDEENGPKPQMYKIEACNSAGDFSTIWMNASENEKSSIEQFRESVRIPVPRKFGVEADAFAKSTDEAETQVVLPVRRPYVKDTSRNSTYLTVKKPAEKVGEKLETGAKDDGVPRLTNGFLGANNKILKDDTLEDSSADSLKPNGEVQAGSDAKDVTLKKTAGRSKKVGGPSTRKDCSIHSTSKNHLFDNDDARGTVISRRRNERQEEADKENAPSSKSTESVANSIQSDASAFVSTNTQAKQLELPVKDSVAAGAKKEDEKNREDDNAAATDDAKRRKESSPEAAPITPEPCLAAKDPVTSAIDKLAKKEEEDPADAPKISAMISREHATRRRSVVSIEAGDANENSASGSAMPTPSVTCLPKPSKINADGNNAVEAPELSLREAAYLANSPRSQHAEDVGSASPGKKANKASNLARKGAPPAPDAAKKASGVGADKLGRKSDAAKPRTEETKLLEGASDDREIAKLATDVETKDIDPTKTANNYVENVPSRELSSETASSSISSSKKKKAQVIVNGTSAKEADLSKPLKTDLKKISAMDVEKDPSRDSGLSSPKSKVPKISGVESRFPFKAKILPKVAVSETSGTDSPEVGKEPLSAPKTTKNDDGKIAPAHKKDANAPEILKTSTSVDSSKSNGYSSSGNANILKKLQQSVSVEEKLADKSMPKKSSESSKFASKVTGKKSMAVDAGCEKPQEQAGQLSKSASSESIDFWSQIKAPDSPEATRSKQQSGVSRETTVTAKIEEKTDPATPKWISSNSSGGKSSTVPIKELEDKKNETDVKISVAPGSSAVSSSDVAEEKTPKGRAVAESPKAKAGAARSARPEVEKMALKVPRKKKNLSIAIGSKDSSSTVKKAPLKRVEDSACSSPQSDADTSGTATPASEVSTPVPEVTVPIINIVEVARLPGSESPNVDEECEEVSTPTNELPDPSFTSKISKWSNRHDLTNADDAETPVASEEASLAASPAASPQSSKTKRVMKKKKPSGKKTASAKSEKATREGKEPSSQQSALTVKPADKQLLAKPSPKTSPRSSPRNSPSQRPLDLVKMFYTTPSALLTATPRDLSKVRRAKIGKRRRHHSRTPSVSSDSTGSTTSTATTESTDGSTCTELDDDPEQKRMNSTRSNDSGFDGSPRISNCDMACHKKCEKLTGNLCGLNQKLVAEALQALKRAPSQSSDNQRNSDSSDHFSSGRITPPATNLPRFKKYAVTDFNFLKVLGKGSFGKVLLAELRGTECVYAVKCLKKDVVLEDDDVECTLIERKVLTLATRHPYLCHLFCTFQTDSHLFFVMEYLNGGDLMFHIQKSGRFPEARARFYAAEIWSGLNFLHKKGIVYRDLKLDNVLLDFDGHIRIADFGMCKLQIFLDRTADTFCGTPDYMAPEIIKGLKYNQSVDWWSYGILLYEMLTGQSPFSGCDEDELFWSICNERPFIPRYLSQDATDILVCLLEKDSGKRPPGHEIAMHAFFQNIPWDRLERRQLEAPFKPALDHTLDTRYFDTAFTTERPRLTPVPEQILTSMDQGVFRGFSYTNPNATD